jgi:L-aminopeptidase/D-esterase-like protein
VVPIVPAAILFDLGRGGAFGNYPGPEAGAAALDAALGPAGAGAVPAGCVGAGTGALAGQLKGGAGSASEVTAGRGVTVAALAVVNSVGSVADARTGVLYGARYGLPGEFDWLRPPSAAQLRDGAGMLSARMSPLNTTVGVVATDARLTKAQCAKLAAVGHDGLARAIRPAHSMFDGDTIFALATGAGPAQGPGLTAVEFHAVLAAAADCFSRAVVHAVLAASPVRTAAGSWPGYLELFPSADGR